MVKQIVHRLFPLGEVVHRLLRKKLKNRWCHSVRRVRRVAQEREVEQHGAARISRAEEVDLDLHGIAHHPKMSILVPALLVIVTRRIIGDTHLVIDVTVEVAAPLS